ncbi:MAG: hypothetical protein OXG82_03750 [Gammaproteobacteria bacterium]|nr:hypothetical protein [Gammaproteobacteria bacterium]
MNAVGRCSKGLVIALALLVGTVASANWQISSTDNRALEFLDAPGVEHDRGPRCTVVFNAGHVMADGVLRLPRGTLEMFIDHDTVAYRESGLSGMEGGNDVTFAPAIQFHRLRSNHSEEVSNNDGTDPVDPTDPEPCGWDGDSYYCENPGMEGREGTSSTTRIVRSSEVNLLVRSGYADYMLGGPLHRRGVELVEPTNVRAVRYGGVPIDPADLQSSYLIDYDEEVLDALRYSEGAVSVRVYFPGYLKNSARPDNPEHPHYVNWTLDMGMMEGEMNEVFTKLGQCADDNDIDGSMARRAVPEELP